MTIESLYKLPKIQEVLFKACRTIPKKLFDEIRKVDPCFIHAHFGPDAYSILPLMDKIDIPLITTFHGYDILTDDACKKGMHFTQRAFIRHRSELAERGAAFIAVSRFVHSRLIEKGFPEEKSIVHYIGVNTDAFSPDPLVERKNVVLFVGRLIALKGCGFLLEAIHRLHRKSVSAEVYIVGSGPMETVLIEQARSMGIKAKFFGSLPQEKVRNLFNIAKVFCVPSTQTNDGRAEAFGLVFLEAQSMGVPVVSFGTGGIPEAVADGKTGILVKDKDVSGLASAIMTLLEDKHLWDTYSANGRMRARAHFNIKSQTAELEKIYSRVA